jgi:hypothetical protein
MENFMNFLPHIPEDIIMNHIIPYTYNILPKKLLNDIRSNYIHTQEIVNMYYFDYNAKILLYDLIIFCNNNIAPVYGIEKKYEKILRRNFTLANKNNTEILDFVFFHFHKNILHNPERKIKFLWGLMTPRERKQFFESYYSVQL